MNRPEADKMYHELRLLSLEDDVIQKEAVLGITSHLTAPGGDYPGLLRYLSWYGENFLLEDVMILLKNRGVQFDRVVDFGAGLGWLGRGIANKQGGMPTLFIDKRQWSLIDIAADLESIEGRKRVLDALKPNDLIVMSELLHCLDDPKKVLEPFKQWPMLIIEYWAWSAALMESYTKQIAKLGCKPVGEFNGIFPHRAMNFRTVGPYRILFVKEAQII